MNVDAEPMTFDEVRKLAKQLEIPDFDVMELDKYKSLAKKYKEPANCIIWIPFEDGGKLGHFEGEQSSPGRTSFGHFVSCFREDDGTLNYQDSFGTKGDAEGIPGGDIVASPLNDFPLTGTNRVFRVNKVKYQSIFANNCGYLALLHLYTHDAVDPAIQRL